MPVTFLTDKDKTLHFHKQTLSEEEKAQARENIGAGVDGVAEELLDSHNVDGTAHADIRELINDHGHTSGEISGLGSLATKSTVSKTDLESSVQTSLGKADTALQSFTETDPTVPSWAKASSKPSYTASEVGAVSYNTQTLNDTQKSQARTNLGLGTLATKSSIAKSDLASAVQTSLGKADTALQSFTETDPTVPSWAKASTKPSYSAGEISGLGTLATKSSVAKSDLASAVQTSLGKADTALQSFTETDPTVPSWAKASTKPSYSAGEISGLGTLATKSSVAKSDLASAVQTSLGKADTALQSFTETDPTVPAWAKASSKPSYTASEVGAVSYNTQTLNDTQKSQARTNLGLGTLATKSSVAKSDLASAVQTSLGKADTALQSFTETDPTVPSWAKASTKPSYSAGEISGLGSLATKSTVSKTDLASAVQTSLGKADTALQSFTETDPTVPAWAKASSKPSYTASEVGAVSYNTQTLNDTQKSQARTNLGLGTLATKSSVAKSDLASAVQTSLGKADTALQSFTETDPTVPSWAKASTKPSYSAGEISGLGTLATKSSVAKSDLASAVQTSLGKADTALQSFTETDPTVPSWAKAPSKPSYTASEVGADASGTAATLIATHNSNSSAHSDIRSLISQLSSEKVDANTVNTLIDAKLAAIINAEEVSF